MLLKQWNTKKRSNGFLRGLVFMDGTACKGFSYSLTIKYLIHMKIVAEIQFEKCQLVQFNYYKNK